MTLRSLVWKELTQRLAPTVTALLAVALGVAALVAVQSITMSSEAQVSQRMQQLGANILILPEEVNLQDYYAADLHGETIPEEYVNRIVLAQKVGVDGLAPKLCINTTYADQQLVLTGILPRTEFYRKSAWQSVDLMMEGLTVEGMDLDSLGQKHEGCEGRSCHITDEEAADLRAYARTRVVHELDERAVIVGSEVSQRHAIDEGAQIELLGNSFNVVAVLPPSGTVDDGRVFAHLHTVQDLSGSGPVVNVIEVMACCEDAASGLVGELDDLLPGTKAVTISQLVDTQVTVNRLMDRLSYVLFAILMLVGGASIASVMFANVSERRRELGTLMALGATPGMVRRLILLKASTIGLAGGAAGLLIGLLIAVTVAPSVMDVTVTLSLQSAIIGSVTACGVALLASYLPARRAALLDPCVCFQEV